MGLQLLQQDIGWNLENDVGDEEYSQRSVVLCSIDNIEVLLEPEYGRIADVYTVPRSRLLACRSPAKDKHCSHIPIQEGK